MGVLKCANCRRADLMSHGLDRAHCLDCGAVTNYKGELTTFAQDVVSGGVNPILLPTPERNVERAKDKGIEE